MAALFFAIDLFAIDATHTQLTIDRRGLLGFPATMRYTARVLALRPIPGQQSNMTAGCIVLAYTQDYVHGVFT